MITPTPLPPPSRKRRIVASALSLLAGAALLMPLVWEESTHMMSDHSARAAFFGPA